jgi:hypothetical protein
LVAAAAKSNHIIDKINLSLPDVLLCGRVPHHALVTGAATSLGTCTYEHKATRQARLQHVLLRNSYGDVAGGARISSPPAGEDSKFPPRPFMQSTTRWA